MKKTGRIICLILTFFVCAFFSACKIDYSGLKMSFCSNSGETIDTVRLLIDSSKVEEHLDQQTIAVQFDGIKQKQIGDVLVSVVPSNLATISNKNLEGNKYFFDLQANEQGVGKITVQHLATGKKADIKISVDQKSTTVTRKVEEFVIAIPNENELLNFDVNALINQDGTDQIGFKVLNDISLPAGVTALTTEFADEKVITGLNLTASIQHNSSVVIYPVSYMEDYDDIDSYEAQTIKITFVRALNENLFVLDTDDAHKIEGNLNLNLPFHLIAKDTSQAPGQNYQFNNVAFDLKYENSQGEVVSFTKIDDQSNTVGLEYLQKYYDVKWEIPNQFKNLLEVFLNETEQTMQLVVEAKDYSSDIANIKIKLEPKIQGNLQTVEKIVKIKCDVKPTEYEISVQGRVQQNNGTKNVYDIDLYDYYRATDSVYGANFTFKPLVEYAYADFKNVKIIVNPAVLDVLREVNGVSTGTNPVSGLDESQAAYATNRYLLQFHIGGKPMNFTIDEETGMAVSAAILYQEDLTRIQIKYTEIANNQNTEQLTCYVQNYYSGEYEYLSGIGLTTATLQFNRKDGVQSADIFAGVLTKGAETDTVATIDDTKSISQVYLNRVGNAYNVFYLINIKGDKNKEISNANFNIKVVGGQNKPLKLLQNIKGNLVLSNAATEINFNYDVIAGNPNNAVIMVVDNETDVGYYQIIVSYADETVYTFTCLVYEELQDEQVSINVEKNTNLIDNNLNAETEQSKLYPAYDADYIVRVDKTKTTDISIELPSQFTTDYIAGYSFEAKLIKNGEALDVNVQEYFNIIVINNRAMITFIKGSVVENELSYVQLAMKVKKQSFSNILTKDGVTESGTKVITFFAYEEIKKEQISLNKTIVYGYWDQLLSAYYKEEGNNLSGVDLKVNMSNDVLWNYIQPQIQDVEKYKIGDQYVLVAETASYSATETYYLNKTTEIAPGSENHNVEYFKQNKDQLYVKSSNVVWYTSNSDALQTELQTQTGISLKFFGKGGEIEYDVYAMIKQFNMPEIVLKCHIVITEPVVTDKVTIVSQTKQIAGENGKRVISLKAGESYTMEVEYYSNKFETLPSSQRVITNPGFVMLVVDKAGNIHNSVVTVEENTLKVKENFVLTADLHVLIFAKDALKAKLQDVSGYNNPEDFLMWDDRNPDNPSYDHRNAYAEIDLVVSNGSKQNPYPIFNAQDFCAINNDKTGLAKTKYYQLMNNIYLNGVETIDNFTGGISTYTNNTYYTIFGLTLTNTTPNLFTNFAGTIQNINFDVKFTYNSASNVQIANTNLGVFGNITADAVLTNVTVNAAGANLIVEGNGDNYYLFGSLVGENSGLIEYTNKSLLGANVNISIDANRAYVGGLVGKNNGTIRTSFVDNTTSGSQNIQFGSFLASQGNAAKVNISAAGLSSGAIGGVVGLNTGSLINVYADGQIVARQGKKLNNVGGVIGKNQHVELDVDVEYDESNTLNGFAFANASLTTIPVLNNLKSSVQIVANDNVGGITGVDENGIYTNSKYQILANSTYGIVGANNVGGIIGHATNSMLEYCSVFSYRWDYSKLNNIGATENDNADISATTMVGGFIGFAVSNTSSISAGLHKMVAVKNSSINAFIFATIEANSKLNMFIGCNNLDASNSTTLSGVLDCYFVGKIAGLDNNANINYVEKTDATNYVYYATDAGVNYLPATGSTIEEIEDKIIVSSRAGWATSDTINNGNSYLVLNERPIFEVAPTSIALQLKEDAESQFGVVDNDGRVINNIIHLELTNYNLDPNSSDYTQLYQQQTQINTFNIKDIFNITAEPEDMLTEVRLSVTSSNSSVVAVSNGNLIARSAGTATIKFASVLNNTIQASIIVYVGEPIGENLSLYLARDDINLTANSSFESTKIVEIGLTKGEAVLLNYAATQFKDLSIDGNGKTFSVTTNTQTYLQVEIAVDGTLPENTTINKYLEISGKSIADWNSENNIGKLNLDYNTPFSIKAKDKIEGVTFKFVVTPYLMFGEYAQKSNKWFEFNVKTTAGITDLSLGCENIILYPNDATTITAYLTTDKEISKTQAIDLVESIKLNDTIITSSSTGDFGAISKYISVLEAGSLDEKLNLQIVKYTLTIPEDIKEKLISNVTNTMFVNFKAGAGLGNGKQDSLQLSLLKQRIDELIVRNYVYQRNQDGTFDYNTYTQNNTLRPVSEGLITIDLAPINGNYDYLEISDITGTEEIVFVQTKGIHKERILTNVQPSADGKGIRLQHVEGQNTSYIATMIDSNFTNRKHLVEVRAYASGTVIKSTTLEIDVKMLPEASIYLVNGQGSVVRNEIGVQYVAQKMSMRFKVETKNSDNVEPTIEAKIVTSAGESVENGDLTSSIINLGNGFYSVDIGAFAGNYVQIDATTQLTLNNGDVEKTTTTVAYQIVNFVINNVSVSHSTTNQVNGNAVTKIYGNLGQNVPVEFYFNNSDLTFVEDKERYDQTTYKGSTDLSPKAINTLIKEINGENALNYLTFDLSRQLEDINKYTLRQETSEVDGIERITKRSIYYTKDSETEPTLIASMSLTKQNVNGVEKNFVNIYQSTAAKIDVVLTLNLGLEENNFYIVTDNDSSLILKQLKFAYQLDFIEESSFLEPLAVRSADDFVNMSSNGDYILAQDITLEDYSPLDVDLNSFDGNGHTITIKSFALFNETSIYAGLFKQIYADMIVMNVNIQYNLGKESTSYYYDLCNNAANVDYAEAAFGGVAAVNEGIISNCNVSGTVMVSASSVENAIDNDSIDFNIGGVVYQNETSGRITNSSSSLVMVAKANIAGFVVENSGKIASSYFDANNGKGKIYAYNNSVTVPYSIQVAGFVLKNNSSAEISMCYVESGTHEKNNSTIGNISAKDYSSGFIFTNSGSIYDCYADIDLIGESSHNHITGFVYENSGKVKNCYSYINEGRKTNLLSMFAREGTSGIETCYEIKQDVSGYKNNVSGLTTISVLARTNKDSYPSLMFGDNVSSVWCKTQSNLPKLVATQEKVEFVGEALSTEDKNKQYPSYYHGLKDLQLVITEVKNDLGVVINREYKYKILANNFGDKQNPILIYSLATWNYYLGQTDVANSYYNNTKFYYRLVNDIDFSTVYNNPSTSTVTFNGNLQGNNMDVTNFKIYSSQNLSSIGLFAQAVSLNNSSIESAIRNLDITPSSITASRTMAVGSLVGVADNYNIYNIDIESQNTTIVGGNAVGGVVGLLRGKFDVDGLSSNIGAYASRSQSENTYSIYSSVYVANRYSASNLNAVYYAGSVVGIADSYNGTSQSINLTNENVLQNIRHVNVYGTPIIFGDTVGGAIGLLGKNIKLYDSIVNITAGNLSGYQYSAGLVGENRGIVQKATVSVVGENLFKNSTFVSSGLVGLNLNGYVLDATVYAEISKTNQSIVAGIVGRNLKGTVQNVSIDGSLNGYYVGAIIGADYGVETFVNKTAAGGGGAIKIAEENLIALTNSTYVGANDLTNLQIDAQIIKNAILNLNSYYSYQVNASKQLEQKAKKVYGLVVGLTDKQQAYNFRYGYNSKTAKFVVNSGLDINAVGYITKTIDENDYTIGLINIINNFELPKDYADTSAVLYLVGAKISSFDFWLTQNGFTGECFAFAQTFTELKNSKNVEFYITKVQGSLTSMTKLDEYDIVSLTGDYNFDFLTFDIESLLTDVVPVEGQKYQLVLDETTHHLLIKLNSLA